MYRCNDCGHIFKDPKEVSENVGEFWGTPAYEYFDVCPCCGSDEFDEYDEHEDEEDDEDWDDREEWED